MPNSKSLRIITLLVFLLLLLMMMIMIVVDGKKADVLFRMIFITYLL
jgi:preprotein translocase subunit SecE